MEHFVRSYECDEPKSASPEGGDISILEVDERGIEVTGPTHFAPVAGTAAAIAVAPTQAKGLQESSSLDGRLMAKGFEGAELEV